MACFSRSTTRSRASIIGKGDLSTSSQYGVGVSQGQLVSCTMVMCTGETTAGTPIYHRLVIDRAEMQFLAVVFAENLTHNASVGTNDRRNPARKLRDLADIIEFGAVQDLPR